MAYPDRVIADGASHYWRLGEAAGPSAADIVGGAPAAITGGVTLGQPGALADGSKAMAFDGIDGKIVSTPITLQPSCTFEAWIKPVGTGGVQRPLCGMRPDEVVHVSRKNTGEMQTYVDGVFTTGTRVVTEDAWHHFVIVWVGGDPGMTEFYLDGTLDVSAVRAHLGTKTAPLRWAWDEPDGIQYWAGLLDELAIYPRALTALEIAAHYALASQSGTSPWPGVPWWTQVGAEGDDTLDSYNTWTPITPSNTVDLARPTKGIWVGGGGDVAAVMQNGTMPVVLAAVPAGAWLPIAAKRINATGTTATGLVALYTS